jgi:hypothetical protein
MIQHRLVKLWDLGVEGGEILTQPGHGRFVRRSLGARTPVAT